MTFPRSSHTRICTYCRRPIFKREEFIEAFEDYGPGTMWKDSPHTVIPIFYHPDCQLLEMENEYKEYISRRGGVS
jgi:hypothetical protein